MANILQKLAIKALS